MADFDGAAELTPLDSFEASVKVARVHFKPGARTHWHSHEDGQVLVVVSGSGQIQQRGGPVDHLKSGQIVVCRPRIPHWHGATATDAMTHIAISGGRTTWLGSSL